MLGITNCGNTIVHTETKFWYIPTMNDILIKKKIHIFQQNSCLANIHDIFNLFSLIRFPYRYQSSAFIQKNEIQNSFVLGTWSCVRGNSSEQLWQLRIHRRTILPPNNNDIFDRYLYFASKLLSFPYNVHYHCEDCLCKFHTVYLRWRPSAAEQCDTIAISQQSKLSNDTTTKCFRQMIKYCTLKVKSIVELHRSFPIS